MILRVTEKPNWKLIAGARESYGHSITLCNIPDHRTILPVTQEVASSSLVGPAIFLNGLHDISAYHVLKLCSNVFRTFPNFSF